MVIFMIARKRIEMLKGKCATSVMQNMNSRNQMRAGNIADVDAEEKIQYGATKSRAVEAIAANEQGL